MVKGSGMEKRSLAPHPSLVSTSLAQWTSGSGPAFGATGEGWLGRGAPS